MTELSSMAAVWDARAEVMTRLQNAARYSGRETCCFLNPARVEAALELHREGKIRCWSEDYNGKQILVAQLRSSPPIADPPKGAA